MDLYLAESGNLWWMIHNHLKKEKKEKEMDIFLAGSESRAQQLLTASEEERKKEMDLYLAGDGGVLSGRVKDPVGKDLFGETNILQSFYYCNKFTEQVIIPNAKKFLLDSGAFTFFSKGSDVDWEAYLKKYADFISRNNVELFFELDIDALVGYDKVLEYRAMLEELTGKRCIPVWHKSRGLDEYYKMCEEYDYVALGGIVTKEITPQDYKYFPKFIDIAHKNCAKIHGLGFTNLKGLTQYKFDSVDSTSWTSGNRFGGIYTFNGKTMVKHNKKEGQRMADQKAVALHNFKEWVKFQKYAELHL